MCRCRCRLICTLALQDANLTRVQIRDSVRLHGRGRPLDALSMVQVAEELHLVDEPHIHVRAHAGSYPVRRLRLTSGIAGQAS